MSAAGASPVEVRGLGEMAIRCADLAAMRAFYGDVLGLPVLAEFADLGIVFFRIAEGHGGHTTVLALFRHDAGRPDLHDRSDAAPETGARSSLHHLALTVDHAAQPQLAHWLRDQGHEVREQTFDWIGWRGLFLRDPEGNTVELVAKDPDWLPSTG